MGVQKYVAYLDLGNGMTEAAMERWASTGTVPGKHQQKVMPAVLCPLYFVCADVREKNHCSCVMAY